MFFTLAFGCNSCSVIWLYQTLLSLCPSIFGLFPFGLLPLKKRMFIWTFLLTNHCLDLWLVSYDKLFEVDFCLTLCFVFLISLFLIIPFEKWSPTQAPAISHPSWVHGFIRPLSGKAESHSRCFLRFYSCESLCLVMDVANPFIIVNS